MIVTSTDIEQHVFDLLKASNIESTISGKIYKSGTRPFDSQKEDIVITYLAGNANQLQSGVINVNAYVPDILKPNIIKNTSRIKAIELKLKEWISALADVNYYFRLDRTIQVYAEPEIKQHFINVRLKYKLLIQ